MLGPGKSTMKQHNDQSKEKDQKSNGATPNGSNRMVRRPVRMTPAVEWVIARAMKHAVQRHDDYCRLEDLYQAMLDQVNRCVGREVPPNDQAEAPEPR